LDDLLGDFPFRSDADRAHAVALFLLPFVRDLIDGPTPLHIIEASTPGTGKSLLADVLLRPSVGRQIGRLGQPGDEDECRRTLTLLFREAPSAIVIDNITQPLNSGTLALALTTEVWTDRLLGKSATVRLPVRCGWVATGNNPVLSTEMARRSARIRLDADLERPWQRGGFRHPNLIAWAQDHRADLVWAALVLVRHWMMAGAQAATATLGSFEQWADVLGGVLAATGVDGFLGNLDALYEAADIEQVA
jgi:putative DNA primase/helicase